MRFPYIYVYRQSTTVEILIIIINIIMLHFANVTSLRPGREWS